MISDKLINEIVNDVNNSITQMAVGSGSEPLPTDLVLDQEQIRKECSSYIDGNEIIKEIYLDETEANTFTITGVGAIDSDGDLQAGGIINETKYDNESMTISIEISVERV